jgi:Holliday junction resolvasome RuvABC endonuclease subunit
LKLVGIDAALNNQGVVVAYYGGKQLKITKIAHLSYPRNPKLTKSRADVIRIKLISNDLRKLIRGADYVMAELVSGSRSASGAWALGAAMGILASLPCDIIWVTPLEVKKATGNPKATKKDMIVWATTKYPNLDWPTYNGRIRASAEHVCDAIGVIHAALPKIPKI